jgi:Ca2+:H+ antiporter
MDLPSVNASDSQPAPLSWLALIDPRKGGWLRAMLIFVPIAVGCKFAGASAVVLFITSALAIVPLAGLMGEATEQLSHRVGAGLGGLLNATFGNAAELIIAMFALFHGLDDVVKASLTGSIIGNLLLVFGASLFAGGLKYPVQRFNRTAAGTGSTMMALAAIGMIVPAMFHALLDQRDIPGSRMHLLEHEVSVGVSVILLAAYGLTLIFSLVTHKDLYNPDDETPESHANGVWPVRKGVVVLLAATSFVAWMSEILVGAVEEAGHEIGLTPVFMGVIIVAIVGNAAEHSTAVLMAMKNRMDLAVGIALGSALQIALFVAPVLVLASYLRSGEPMDLLFSTFEVAAVILSVMLARMVAEDGESNWLEGAMLLMMYALLAVAFFFIPGHPTAHQLANPAAPAPASASRTQTGQ